MSRPTTPHVRNLGLAALLLLADSRFPAGGYAHSGGLEPMIEAGRVLDVDTLESFLRGRAATAGLVAAGVAAAACGAVTDGELIRLTVVDLELDARMPHLPSGQRRDSWAVSCCASCSQSDLTPAPVPAITASSG
jgi:urease accessory protein UreF